MRLCGQRVQISGVVFLAIALGACGSSSSSVTTNPPSSVTALSSASNSTSASDSTSTGDRSPSQQRVSAAFRNDPTVVTVEDAAIAHAIANLPATARTNERIAAAAGFLLRSNNLLTNLSNDLTATIAELTTPTNAVTLTDTALTLAIASADDVPVPQELAADVGVLLGNPFDAGTIINFPGPNPSVGGAAVVVREGNAQFAAGVASTIDRLPSSVALGRDVSFPPTTEIVFPSPPDRDRALRVSFRPRLTASRTDPEPYSAEDLGCDGNRCFLPSAIDIIPSQSASGEFEPFLTETDDYRVTYEFQDASGTTVVSRFLTIRPRESLPIQDAGLLAAIGDRLNVPVAALDTAAVSEVNFLDAEERNIQSLEGIEVLSYANRLTLDDNQITNIEPIGRLNARLETLELDDNSIQDIQAISQVAALRDLDIADNQVRDLSPLLNNLGLLNSPGIRQIDVSGNPIDDNSLNVVIPALQDVSGIRIVFDVPMAEALAAVLRDRNNLDPGSSITNSIATRTFMLDASGRDLQTSDIDGIEAVGAGTLSLADNQITDISALVETQPYLRDDAFNSALLKENLVSLDISNNPISDISPLDDLPLLRDLTMVGTQVSDISLLLDIEGLSGIQSSIDVSQNTLNAAAYTAVIPTLQSRDIRITFDLPIADENLAAALREERGFDPDDPITNDTGIIFDVNASNRGITSIEGIQGVDVSRLNLANNQITDLSPLLDRPSYLPGTTLSRTTYILDPGNLSRLDVTGNPLDDNSISVVIPELEARGITVIRSQ